MRWAEVFSAQAESRNFIKQLRSVHAGPLAIGISRVLGHSTTGTNIGGAEGRLDARFRGGDTFGLLQPQFVHGRLNEGWVSF